MRRLFKYSKRQTAATVRHQGNNDSMKSSTLSVLAQRGKPQVAVSCETRGVACSSGRSWSAQAQELCWLIKVSLCLMLSPRPQDWATRLSALAVNLGQYVVESGAGKPACWFFKAWKVFHSRGCLCVLCGPWLLWSRDVDEGTAPSKPCSSFFLTKEAPSLPPSFSC
jgi:hypothetical protein